MTTETEKEAAIVPAADPTPPLCHMTPMVFMWADDGCQQVDYWECRHCGYTKEIQRYLAGQEPQP